MLELGIVPVTCLQFRAIYFYSLELIKTNIKSFFILLLFTGGRNVCGLATYLIYAMNVWSCNQ